ncbi:MAG: hypothetical protein R2795_18005 [Saprospiraceae bacterium]
MINKLDELRESISSCLAIEKSYNLPSVCNRYSLEEGDESEAFQSKFKYVIRRLKDKDEKFLIELAKKLIDDYQSYQVGYSLNKYLENQFYKLTELTRRNLVEELLKLSDISGSLTSEEILLKSGLSDHVHINSFGSIFGIEEGKDLLQDLLTENIMYQILDSQFLIFLEQLVHPVTRNEKDVQKYLEIINPIIGKDDFELIQDGHISGRPVFKGIQRNGVKGKIKNLIFASKGYKPEIVIKDALNNDIKVVKHEDSCLVYSNPIKNDGLKWIQLVEWWASNQKREKSAELAKELFDRLNMSLDSQPEKEMFKIYYYHYGKLLGKKLPALIPQVYLHYDPYSIRKYGIQYLLRQRMDFLILFSNTKRVVIEIDVKQHYSEGDKPSPKLYSDMVRLDRELKFLNYDVYRLGGYELTHDMESTTISFFDNLFEKYL